MQGKWLKSLRFALRTLLRASSSAAACASVQNFEGIIGTMPNNLRIRTIGLIVGYDVQRKARFRHAVVDDFLLNVAFTRSQESGAASAAVEALINSRAVIQVTVSSVAPFLCV